MTSGCIVVMGVAGCGKTSVGSALAEAVGGRYVDADALHPPGNIAKMSAGRPLTDEDRWPWLDAVGAIFQGAEGVTVVGCSALKRAYRDRIRAVAGRPVTFLYLRGDRALIAGRMARRTGHFMPLSLLDSQFAALEPPAADEQAVTVDIDAAQDEVVRAALVGLGLEARRRAVSP